MSRVNDISIDRLILFNSLSGDSISLLDSFVKMNIFEDMFMNNITGTIQIIDSVGLIEKFPLRGDEQILIQWRASSLESMETYSKAFDVIKITDIEEVEGKRYSLYTLHLSTPIEMASRKNRLSIAFDDKESNIVKEIVKNNMKLPNNIEVEESLNKIKFIVPNWSPLQTINYLAKRAVKQGGLESSSYLFYEDKNQFNFKSLESLVSGNTQYRFHQHLPEKIGEVDFYAFKTLYVDKYFDSAENSQYGAYGSTTVNVDILNKEVTKTEHKFQDMFDKFPKMDPNAAPLKKRDIDSTKRSIYYTYSNDYISGRDQQHSTRDFVMGLFENYKLVGQVEGNTNITIGRKAQLDIHGMNLANPDDLNRTTSGNYIITAVRHEISLSEAITTVEFRKPAMKEETE